MPFVVFEKFTSAYLHQIVQESQDRRNFDSARTLLVIYTRVTHLYLCYMKNAMSFFLILEINFISEDPFCIILAPAPNGDFRPRWAWSLKRLSSYKVV